MRRRRKREIKAINSDIARLSKIIGDKIIEDSSSIESKMSRVVNTLFIENELKISTEGCLKECQTLTVHYILYLTENEIVSHILVPEMGKSRVDIDTNKVIIVSSFIKERVAKNFYDVIASEIAILYKNECNKMDRDSIREKATLLLNEEKEGSIKRNIALCLYYTYSKKQDELGKQFYDYLADTKNRWMVDTAIDKYPVYKEIKNAYKTIEDRKDDLCVTSYINELGINIDYFFELIDYYKNVIVRILCNSCRRYNVDNTSISSQFIMAMVKIMEEYEYECRKRGHEVEWSNECIYNF